jgi:Glycosyltransferase family 87
MRAVAGLGLILAALVASLLAAACLRQQGLVSTLLAAYVALTTNLALATLVLSPFREVTRTGLAVVEAVLLIVSALAWWALGRPRPPLAPARAALRELASSRLTALYLAAIGLLLAYELVLALTVPPNNWDSLTYHLARVAAWYHHGGVYWVPNAPTDRINEFQPLAEQQIYFLFVATGSALLYAIPQYLAQLAILAAVYEAARRLGYAARPAACGACLLATFGLVAYEATTSQNDLVAAALPVVAACFLLDGSRVESVVAGFAAGTALGVKLTTILVWPVLVGLALLRGRPTFVRAALGAAVGFVAVGCWSFALNLAHTGHVLGHGGGRVEHTAGPSFPGSLVTLLSIAYTTLDLSVLWPAPIILLTVVGLAAALAVAWRSRRAGRRGKMLAEGAQVALPFLAPVLMIAAAAVLAAATRALGTPVRGPGGSYNTLGFFGGLNNTADENLSAFGPIGGALLFGLPLFVAAASAGGRARIDRRELVLAAAFPSFLVLLALQVAFNPWFPRFLVVPAALTAPLFARLFTGRVTTAAYLLVSVGIVALGITRLDTKRLFSSFGAPWHLTEAAAVSESGQAAAARALAAFQARVPPGSSVGAVLSGDFPAYLLGGTGSLGRRVVFLRAAAAADDAARARLGYVVIANQRAERPAAHSLAAHGWSLRPLGGPWLLAVSPAVRRE